MPKTTQTPPQAPTKQPTAAAPPVKDNKQPQHEAARPAKDGERKLEKGEKADRPDKRGS